MKSLLLVSLYEFKQFLQIVGWIAVPLVIVAILLTVFFHYRHKYKKGVAVELAFPDAEERRLVEKGVAMGALGGRKDLPEEGGIVQELVEVLQEQQERLKKQEAAIARLESQLKHTPPSALPSLGGNGEPASLAG